MKKKDLIKAFIKMKEGYWTIVKGFGNFGSGPFDDQLEKAFNSLESEMLYRQIFKYSFDEQWTDFNDWCNCMIDKIKKFKESTNESVEIDEDNMELNEAKKILKENGYLCESAKEELEDMLFDVLGEYINPNKFMVIERQTNKKPYVKYIILCDEKPPVSIKMITDDVNQALVGTKFEGSVEVYFPK